MADNLRSFRKSKHLTQKELSKLSSVNVTYIGYVENNRYAISVDVLEKLANGLHTDPCILLAKSNFIFNSKNKEAVYSPPIFKQGEVAFAFWTAEGMEFHPLSKNKLKTAITIISLLQANGYSGKNLYDYFTNL